ncbi:AIM24 family protein [Actinocatenispora thailandica]|nr:AIM24 family protein [Actinocatenispora thailandica]
MTAPTHHYTCRYCRHSSDPTGVSCPRCGAPVDVTAAVTRSGWQRQEPITDMARIQFGQSYLQVEGTQVPVADFTLAGDESIYFSHHSLLWTDPQARLASMGLSGGWKRVMSGLPLFMITGRGPGHIALSDNHAGDLVCLPLEHGQSIWTREHRFLAATGNVTYDWQNTGIWFRTRNGDETETHYPIGMFGDVFTARDAPGLLLLHSPGNTFVRDLAPNQPLLIQPSALLYRDRSVQMHLHLEYPRSNGGFFTRSYSYRNVWLRLIGPGRVAVSSVTEPPEASNPIVRSSPVTSWRW